MAQVSITATTYDIPCQSFACTERAKWHISAHPEDLINALFLCDECAESLFKSMLESSVAKRVLGRLAGSVRETPQEARSAPGSDIPKPPISPGKPKSADPTSESATRRPKPKAGPKPKSKASGARSAGRGRSAADPGSKPT